MSTTVGDRIEELAKARGLSYGKSLADAFGVSYETLRKWRSGKTAPNRSRAELVAAHLGVKPEAFMHGAVAAAQASQPKISPIALKVARRLDAIADHDQFRAAYMAIMDELDRIDRSWSQPEATPLLEPTVRPARDR